MTLAYALFANHLATYVLLLLTVPSLHFIVVLEERELHERFPSEYADYCRRVPRFFPGPASPLRRADETSSGAPMRGAARSVRL